jgi:hypothetical protein
VTDEILDRGQHISKCLRVKLRDCEQATCNCLSLADILLNFVIDMHSRKLQLLFLKYLSLLSITQHQNVSGNAVADGCVESVMQCVHTYQDHVLQGYSCSRPV